MCMLYLIECPAGFLGDNCSISCPYPSYGTLCNQMCGCSKSSCHHVFGCSINTSSTTGIKKKFMLTCLSGIFSNFKERRGMKGIYIQLHFSKNKNLASVRICVIHHGRLTFTNEKDKLFV